jgi:hypothetical protein
MSDEIHDDAAPPLWQSIVDLGATVPPEEWDRLPGDLAGNLDTTFTGAPARKNEAFIGGRLLSDRASVGEGSLACTLLPSTPAGCSYAGSFR